MFVLYRRSQYRAGTRYKRRGVDVDGHVANFVETEQILLYHTYALRSAILSYSGSQTNPEYGDHYHSSIDYIKNVLHK